MTGQPPGAGAAAAAEQILAETYRTVIAFARDQAVRGDPLARRLYDGMTRPSRPVPQRSAVRQWLANVAADVRLVFQSGEAHVASELMAAMQARERLAPGTAERVWQEVVAEARGGAGGSGGFTVSG